MVPKKSILIHTHFHRRRTGVTRSIENVLPFFKPTYETYIYGYGIEGDKISFKKLIKLFFSKRDIVVHCHRNNEIILFLLFRFLGAKFQFITTRHAETNPSGFTMWLLGKSDQCITLTTRMHESLKLPNTTIGHGVNTAIFSPSSKVILEGVLQKNIVSSVGRVRKAKGTAVLLNAFAPVLKKEKDWALVIVGKVDKPDFLKELKTIVANNTIENQVYFLKETPNILPVYQKSHTVVVPSFTEGFSLVCAEAMSCGCNVVATENIGVHSDLITNGENGYLFEAGNRKELQSLLQKIVIQELPHLGQIAREEIVVNWSAKKEAEGLMELYKTI